MVFKKKSKKENEKKVEGWGCVYIFACVIFWRFVCWVGVGGWLAVALLLLLSLCVGWSIRCRCWLACWLLLCVLSLLLLVVCSVVLLLCYINIF